MANIPAYCSNCGAIFPSLNFKGSGQITLIGNVTKCPLCGEMADILDGVFTVTNDVLDLLSGPQFTRDALRAISTLIERAAKAEITPEELEKEATAINPELGAALSAITKLTWPKATLFALYLLLRQCDFDVNVGVDVNQLWDQIYAQEIVLETTAPTTSIGEKSKPKNPKDNR